MPSHRKRIGFLPSEEVHEIIDILCQANEFSQSKVTGLLVEEALMSRGVLNKSFISNNGIDDNFVNKLFPKDSPSKNNKSTVSLEDYKINKKSLSDDIRMMHEFIEFKQFKKVMNQNNDFI